MNYEENSCLLGVPRIVEHIEIDDRHREARRQIILREKARLMIDEKWIEQQARQEEKQ